MNDLKVAFVDFWPEWNVEDFITPILKKHFHVLFDYQNPDIIFHSIFNKMQESPRYKCKKVLILAENWRPSQLNATYSISFDPHTPENFRLPLWQIYMLLWPELKTKLFLMNRYKEIHEKWCAFTVSNPSNFFRNSLFHQLNEYKLVSSYGRYLNNDNKLIMTSEGKYWRYAKTEFFNTHSHKFMMAIENSPYKYYCTEKLMDAFLGFTLPIYWGDTRVAEDWNEKAFINGTKIDILEAVKKIDKDDGLYKAMMMEPVFTKEQMEKLENNLQNFESWLINTVKK